MSMLMNECLWLSEQYAVELSIEQYTQEEWAIYLEQCENEGGLAAVYKGMKNVLIQQGVIRIH